VDKGTTKESHSRQRLESVIVDRADEVIATGMEAYANFGGRCSRLAKVAGAILKIVRVTEDGELDQAGL